jgi:effector-binding domain-containing protein
MRQKGASTGGSWGEFAGNSSSSGPHGTVEAIGAGRVVIAIVKRSVPELHIIARAVDLVSRLAVLADSRRLPMIDPPQIVQSNHVITAVIHLTVPRKDIQTVMGPAIAEVIAAASAQGAGPAGPVFSHHLKMDPEIFDFEVGVPVNTSVTEIGRVKPGELPATIVARTIYHGPYEGLGAAWAEFCAWTTANGRKCASDLWEFYLSGPESSPDPSTWRTELDQPLLEKD